MARWVGYIVSCHHETHLRLSPYDNLSFLVYYWESSNAAIRREELNARKFETEQSRMTICGVLNSLGVA